MFFDDLKKDEIAIVEKNSAKKKVSKGTNVVEEGEKGAILFIVQEGALEIQKDLGKGMHKFLKKIGPGEFFGEMSFLGTMPRTATVKAVTDCSFLMLSLDHFKQLEGEFPLIAMKLMKNIARELAFRLKKNNEDLKQSILWALEGAEF